MFHSFSRSLSPTCEYFGIEPNDTRSNSPVLKRLELCYICNDNSIFMLGTIDQARRTCARINSTIKTYYSKEDMVKLMTDPRVVKNETKDMIFTFDNPSNPHLSRLVWTGTQRTNYFELIDEFGKTFTLPEFRKQFGFQMYLQGDNFPSSVTMTKNFKFTTRITTDCFCVYKTIDISFSKS